MTEQERGYTLIELAVVVLLVGLMLTLAAPRVRDTLLNDDLKAATRQLLGATRELRNDAIREQTDYLLRIDLGQPSFWSYPADATPEKRAEVRKAAVRLPAGIRIVDVRHAGEAKKGDGEASIRFFRQGYVTPTVIHLAKDDRTFTLIFNPFLPSVDVHEKQVDYAFNEEDRDAAL
ncbi:MAG: prepilin-type N-terminal cleavage/methylation domain-containing protein [Deltaproteobacteria bacterium]|nr:prepilin-type N-terminal cleavage/methylation domain-containing protein [Deltaproteobacteria bacterium]